MKKLLVLALVMGIASLASAGLTTTGLDLKIVDNGDGTFGIQSLTDYASGKDTYYAAVSTVNFPVKGAAVVLAGAPASTDINDDAVVGGAVPLPAGMNGVWGFIGDSGGAAKLAGLWIDGIQSAKGTTITLYEVNGNWELGNVADVVTLVPEPMTMGLLGLGALFLRKRK